MPDNKLNVKMKLDNFIRFGLKTLVCLFFILSSVRGYTQEITLVTTGEGETKREAITDALRSAIEQSFTTFVSANTSILDDEIVKDDAVTITSGNIKSYKELSCEKTSGGFYQATVSATVSIGKLIEFAKSHGSSAEFAGQTFLMNMRMRDLNKKNEKEALENLLQKVKLSKDYLFEGKIVIKDPKAKDGGYQVPIELDVLTTKNFPDIYDIITNTLSSLSLSPAEFREYKANDENVTLVVKDFNMNSYETGVKYKAYGPDDFYYFRNDQKDVRSVLSQLCNLLNEAYRGVKIKEKGGKGRVLGITGDDFLFKEIYVNSYPGPFKDMDRTSFIKFGPSIKIGSGNDQKGLQLTRDANKTITKQTVVFDYPNKEELGKITGYETFAPNLIKEKTTASAKTTSDKRVDPDGNQWKSEVIKNLDEFCGRIRGKKVPYTCEGNRMIIYLEKKQEVIIDFDTKKIKTPLGEASIENVIAQGSIFSLDNMSGPRNICEFKILPGVVQIGVFNNKLKKTEYFDFSYSKKIP